MKSSIPYYFLIGMLHVFFVSVSSFPAIAQETVLPRLEAKIISDEVFKASQVSGEWLVGVHWQSDAKTKRPSLLTTVPHWMAGKKLCTTGVAISGLFKAVFEYQVPTKWKTSLAALAFPTQHLGQAEVLDDTNSGVTIQPGPCSQPENRFFVSYWNVGVSKTSTLIINLNSQNSDEVFLYFGDKAKDPTVCEQVSGSVKTAFDFQCKVLLKLGVAPEVKIEIQRFRNGIENIPQFTSLIFSK